MLDRKRHWSRYYNRAAPPSQPCMPYNYIWHSHPYRTSHLTHHNTPLYCMGIPPLQSQLMGKLTWPYHLWSKNMYCHILNRRMLLHTNPTCRMMKDCSQLNSHPQPLIQSRRTIQMPKFSQTPGMKQS
jgi:hypothetical protein